MSFSESSTVYRPLNEAGTGQYYSNGQGGAVIVVRFSWFSLSFALITCLLAVTAAFAAGLHQAQLHSVSDVESIMKIERSTQVFTYNQTFSERPSPNSDSVWESIFPLQGGFFRHPVIATERSACSVFHQLHCLNGIRTAYWAFHDAALEGKKLQEEDLPMMSSARHIQHCIELLRQGLMCNADFTVEKKEPEVGGVLGFGTEHQCWNWEQVLSWMTEWEVYKQGESE